jgi:murein DD-endopeptidase MepM/ murein hydrolase activator NlpD
MAAAVLSVAVLGVRFLDLNASPAPAAPAMKDRAPLSTLLPLPAPQGLSGEAGKSQSVAPTPVALQLPPPPHQAITPAPAVEQPQRLAMAEPASAALAAPSLLAGEESKSDGMESEPNAAATTASSLALAQPGEVETPTPSAVRKVEYRVAKGDSLAKIFADKDLDAALLHRIIHSSKAAEKLADIRPGQTFKFTFDDAGELVGLELHRTRVESVHVTISDDNIRTERVSRNIERRVATATGVIQSSLFVDGQKAGLADGQIMDLVEIFGWDIDFALEIRAGDSFRVLYEEHYLEGEKLRDGPILAAEFTNRGDTHTAVRYEDGEGQIGYYDADGNSKRRAFIRTPIKFARISSRYNPRRWHPVLKKWRSHKGVDYAAPTGTPIKATGDGRVTFRGSKSGYGKTVIIEHAGKYTTLYAHMSQYSKRARQGQRVKQGQVIGYVGKTGLATGPHLHYEFRVNGKHRDPLRVKLPKSLSLTKTELAEFRRQTTPLLTQLAAIPSNTMVASADDSQTR